MTYQISLYSVIFLAALLIAAITTTVAWQRRRAPGGLALFLMMVAILVWTVAGLMEASAVGLSDKILWSKIAYLGAHTAPPLFLLFAAEYTHRRHWLTPLNIGLLFSIPTLTILFAATNEWHHLVWTGFAPNPAAPNSYLYFHGPWFWVATIYINAVLFVGTFLLFQFVLRSKELYRYQTLALVVAALFPWASFVIYLFNLSPLPGLDITAISFAFTGAILTFAISGLSFLDVIPIAREALVENMVDGLLVLDAQDRIVDLNPAVRQIFGVNPYQSWIGQPAEALLPDHPDLVQCFHSFQQSEWRLAQPEIRYFDLQVSPVYGRAKQLTGKLIIFRDVTGRKEFESDLRQSNEQLAEKLAEIEKLKDELSDQAIRDDLTGLYNRRHLDELLTHALAQAIRGNQFLSVVIIDIDHFKEHNDNYGHLQGDSLLRAFGVMLQTHFRAGDIACRYGGDEFTVVMPGSTAADAYARVEALRQTCKNMPLGRPDSPASITFSAGIAAYSAHGETAEELLRNADQALYQAKTQGRSRTCFP